MISAEEIRKKMRVSHAYMDGDIQDNMDAALLDLSRVGVNVEKADALMDKAVELYCKAQFDYLGKGEQFLKQYESLRDSMSMAEVYQ